VRGGLFFLRQSVYPPIHGILRIPMGVSGKPAGGMGKAVRFADPAGRVRKPWMPERRPPMPISAEVVRVCEECGHGYAEGDIHLFEPDEDHQRRTARRER
jgi:hypothetical protein